VLVLVALWQHQKTAMLQKETRQARVDYCVSRIGTAGEKEQMKS